MVALRASQVAIVLEQLRRPAEVAYWRTKSSLVTATPREREGNSGRPGDFYLGPYTFT